MPMEHQIEERGVNVVRKIEEFSFCIHSTHWHGKKCRDCHSENPIQRQEGSRLFGQTSLLRYPLQSKYKRARHDFWSAGKTVVGSNSFI